MKKLLTLLGVMAISGSPTAFVASCGIQESATNIINKIKKLGDIVLPQDTVKKINNPQTISAIKKQLSEMSGGNLTNNELSTLTFTGSLDNAGKVQGAKITVQSSYNGTEAKTPKTVFTFNPETMTNEIKNKITDVNLTVPAGTNPSTANAATVAAIKTALKADNTSLTAADLNTITFNNTTLVAGQSKNVTATITVGTATATKTLNVTLEQTDQQKANAIKNKITDVNLTVPAGTNPSTANAATVAAIKTVLKADNTSLTAADLNTITFNNTTLVAGQSKNVTATITVGTGAQGATATKRLSVTLEQTPQQKANAIKNKITDTALTIPYASTKTVAANTAAIKNELKVDNPILTTADLAKITFSSGIFNPGVALSVTATITVVGVPTVTVTKTLQVTMQTAQQTADAIKAKITDVDLTIPFSSTKTLVANTTAIKTVLKADNTSLTTSDLAKITFTATGDFVPGTAKAVTATITIGSGAQAATATKVLQITMQI